MGIRISSTTGSKIIGAMVKAKGEEFVKKLREQQIKLYSIDAPALEWVPMGLVPNNVGSAAVALNPPHPHAAVLMADLLLGPDGRKVLEKFCYGSATKSRTFKRWRPERGLTTEKYEKEIDHWEKLLKQVGRK